MPMPKKILLVEDEPDMRELVKEKLLKEGYEVFEAGNGREAFTMAQEHRPDLVISDVLMPELDGNTFLKQLRQTVHGKDLPFIVVTARVKMRDYFEAVQVDAFFEKPFKMADLVMKIKEIFEKKGADAAINGGEATSSGRKPLDIKLNSAMEATVSDGMLNVKDYDAQDTGIPGAVFKKDRDQAQRFARGGKKKRILLGEDDARAAGELGKYFLKYGFAVETVDKAEDCFEGAKEFQPQVIVLNYAIGDASGVEMANRMKMIPSISDIPIIIYREVFVRGKDGEIIGRLTEEGKQLLSKVHELLG